MPKVPSYVPDYSRFGETMGGDGGRSRLPPARRIHGAAVSSLGRAILGNPSPSLPPEHGTRFRAILHPRGDPTRRRRPASVTEEASVPHLRWRAELPEHVSDRRKESLGGNRQSIAAGNRDGGPHRLRRLGDVLDLVGDIERRLRSGWTTTHKFEIAHPHPHPHPRWRRRLSVWSI